MNRAWTRAGRRLPDAMVATTSVPDAACRRRGRYRDAAAAAIALSRAPVDPVLGAAHQAVSSRAAPA